MSAGPPQRRRSFGHRSGGAGQSLCTHCFVPVERSERRAELAVFVVIQEALQHNAVLLDLPYPEEVACRRQQVLPATLLLRERAQPRTVSILRFLSIFLCSRCARRSAINNQDLSHLVRNEHDLRRRIRVRKRQFRLRLESRGISLVIELRQMCTSNTCIGAGAQPTRIFRAGAESD